MSLYLLFAPLSPVFMLMTTRRFNGSAHVIVALCAFCTFIPVAIISTVIRNQFAIDQVIFSARALRFLFSDYCIQILCLMLALVILRIAVGHEAVAGDPASAVLVFCCCYFFCESLYRLLFIPTAANMYELFVFPTIRLILIMVIYTLMANFRRGKQLIISFGCMTAITIGAAILATLLWFKFLVIGFLILITCTVISIWHFIRVSTAA